MFKVKSCCCGCSLKTGSLIIGYAGAVCSGISILTYLIVAFYLKNYFEPNITDNLSHDINNLLNQHQDYTPFNTFNDSYDPKILNVSIDIIALYCTLATIPCIIYFTFQVLLIAGVEKERPGFLMAWLIFDWFLSTFYWIVMLIVMVGIKNAYPLFVFIPFIGIDLYLKSVVYSLYEQLKKKTGYNHERLMENIDVDQI